MTFYSLRQSLKQNISWCEVSLRQMSAAVVVRAEDRPFGPGSLLESRSLGGSGMLQSVPAQVASQVQEASLLHTCTFQTEIKMHFFNSCIFVTIRW